MVAFVYWHWPKHMGAALTLVLIALLLAFNVFAVDALTRMQADVQVIRRAVLRRPARPAASAAPEAAVRGPG